MDNIQRQDIPPLSGDFNVNGGLYRPAHLIVPDQVCVSPSDYASYVVYLTNRYLNVEKATVQIVSLVNT